MSDGMSGQRVVPVERKSVGLAFLLTLVFGPLGMLYTTVGGAIVMFIVASVLIPLTGGLAAVVIWPICMLWGCMAAGKRRRHAVVLG